MTDDEADRRTMLLAYLRQARADGVWTPRDAHSGMIPLVHSDVRDLIDARRDNGCAR